MNQECVYHIAGNFTWLKLCLFAVWKQVVVWGQMGLRDRYILSSPPVAHTNTSIPVWHGVHSHSVCSSSFLVFAPNQDQCVE